MIFSFFISGWLNDGQNSPTKEEIELIGSLETFLLLGFIGIIADKVNLKQTLPCALLARSAAFLGAYFIKDSSSSLIYTILPLTQVSYYAVLLINLSYL